jgi:hypothetical protein
MFAAKPTIQKYLKITYNAKSLPRGAEIRIVESRFIDFFLYHNILYIYSYVNALT